MRSSPHPSRLPYPSPHEVPKQALSLLFNLSCPVWQALHELAMLGYLELRGRLPLSRLPPGYLRRIGD